MEALSERPKTRDVYDVLYISRLYYQKVPHLVCEMDYELLGYFEDMNSIHNELTVELEKYSIYDNTQYLEAAFILKRLSVRLKLVPVSYTHLTLPTIYSV